MIVGEEARAFIAARVYRIASRLWRPLTNSWILPFSIGGCAFQYIHGRVFQEWYSMAWLVAAILAYSPIP